MPRRCTICHHPQHEEIAVSLFRNGTRATARSFRVSLPALHRHRQHLSGTMMKAQQARVVSEATSLLSRVESLMQESEKIAAAAKLDKNWPAATSALREARGCLELLGKLGGELQTGRNIQLGVAVNVGGSQPEPQTLDDLELATAQLIAEATLNFDPAEIFRLKALLERACTASPYSSMPAPGMIP